jgi:hypothetical protein
MIWFYRCILRKHTFCSNECDDRLLGCESVSRPLFRIKCRASESSCSGKQYLHAFSGVQRWLSNAVFHNKQEQSMMVAFRHIREMVRKHDIQHAALATHA